MPYNIKVTKTGNYVLQKKRKEKKDDVKQEEEWPI